MNSRKIGSMIKLFFLSALILLISVTEGHKEGETSEYSPKSFSDAADIIQTYVNSYQSNSASSLCQENTCCNITTTEACSISQMPSDQSTLVLPGGNTRCISSESTPFAFQVIPGESDKLLVYFQGGGACWDKVSTKLGFCSFDVSPQSPIGIFDRTNKNNQFRTYTIVHVMYCSGDVFVGNSTRPYTDSNRKPYRQVGLLNAQSAVDWVKSQVKSGLLASTFNELVVMGCSAGSIGAQLWGNQVLSQLSWKHAAVIPDSYAGVFPKGSMGPLMYDFGFCQSGFLSAELYEKCMNQVLELSDIDLEYARAMPNVPFAFIQSKTDVVQMAFYWALAATTGTPPVLINPTEFYNGVNEIFGSYNAQLPNFVTYLVDGHQHCFTPKTVFYEADTKGPEDEGKSTSTQMVYDWVNQYPLEEGSVTNTRCDGTLQGDRTDNTYCSSSVNPKSFTEQW